MKSSTQHSPHTVSCGFGSEIAKWFTHAGNTSMKALGSVAPSWKVLWGLYIDSQTSPAWQFLPDCLALLTASGAQLLLLGHTLVDLEMAPFLSLSEKYVFCLFALCLVKNLSEVFSIAVAIFLYFKSAPGFIQQKSTLHCIWLTSYQNTFFCCL